MSAKPDPLAAPPPEEIPLERAPLVRVIAQVRHAAILAVERPDYVADFQESIRGKYPMLHRDETRPIVAAPLGPSLGPAHSAWRFEDPSRHWRVSLAPDFLALETSAYSNRAEFLDRLRTVIDAAARHLGPELLAASSTVLERHAIHAFNLVLFAVPDPAAHLQMRWGRLPPGTTFDPSAIEPVQEPAWILDLDMFSSGERPFDPPAIIDEFARFAERICTAFRWAVTEAFLNRVGGSA